MYETLLKITTKDLREFSYVMKSYREWDQVRAYASPYHLGLCSDISELQKMIIESFKKFTDSGEYNYFYRSSEFIKSLGNIKKIEDIECIEISGRYDDIPKIGDIITRFYPNELKYEEINTADIEKLRSDYYDVLRFFSYFSVPEISLRTLSHIPRSVFNNIPYVYNSAKGCLVCANCNKDLAPRTGYVSKKHKMIYCDKMCTPDSTYATLRRCTHGESKAVITEELIHTNKDGRAERIESLVEGTGVQFEMYDNEAMPGPRVNIISETGSIGLTNHYYSPLNDALLDILDKKNDSNIKYNVFVSNVIPKSQRGKNKKPIVNVSLNIELFI